MPRLSINPVHRRQFDDLKPLCALSYYAQYRAHCVHHEMKPSLFLVMHCQVREIKERSYLTCYFYQ